MGIYNQNLNKSSFKLFADTKCAAGHDQHPDQKQHVPTPHSLSGTQSLKYMSTSK